MSDLKVVLMYPNLRWCEWEERTLWNLHPYNLGLLTSMVRDFCDVEIFDGTLKDTSKEEFRKIIANKKPDLVGISILTNEYSSAGLCASKIVKEASPETKVVMGGVHATSNGASVIREDSIDYVVMGEGEYVFRDLCKFLKGEGDIPKKGLAFKKDGKIIDTGRADFIQDLDAIPYPSYDKMDFERYINICQREEVGRPREMPYANMITSRGCPHRCCFCEVAHITGRKPRLRSVENIIGEIDLLVQNYGIKSLTFHDDNMMVNKERAKKLFQTMIQKNYNFKWNNPALPLFHLDEELIGLMRESGCCHINAAIESGVERVLKDIIHKPLDLEYGKKMLKELRRVGIDTCANFIVGFPGETWDEIRETLKFAENLEVDYVKIFNAVPFPNTELYEVCKKQGYLRQGFNANKHLWTDGWIETPEFTSDDVKMLRAYEWDRINFTDTDRRRKIAEMMGISEEKLMKIRRDTLNRAHKK